MNNSSRYERQQILRHIGREGQDRLSQARVAVVGLGALGSVSSGLLARAGVGHLLVVDRDFLELHNLQRQILYDEADVRENLPKAVVAKRKLESINSEIYIREEVADINSDTIDEVLGGVDLVIDGTDNIETRFLINDYCLKNRIPWIYGGAIGTEGMSYVILAEGPPCLRCLFGEAPSPGTTQTCDQVGILAPVAHLIASFQATEAIKLLAGKKDMVDRKLWKVDLWSRQFKAISVDHLKESPCRACRYGDYTYLMRRAGSQAVTLCGRNAVQIYSHRKDQIDFKRLAANIAGSAEVSFNDYLLNIRTLPYEITLFQNGRAIVKGTEDTGQARSLYAKYVGH